MKEKVLLSWSGGKDAALTLHQLQGSTRYTVSSLLTTITEEYDRVTMHGTRRALIEQQAGSLSLPLHTILLPRDISEVDYADTMARFLQEDLDPNIRQVAFGDVFLEDVHQYREQNLAGVGMKAVFPLWGLDTRERALRFIDLGFQAIVNCVDSHALEGSLAGSAFNERFLSELPPTVDPCGENGEFHTFVYDGPIFRRPIPFHRGEIVVRDDRFYYCDLLPDEHPA
jgi:uncharacterized protein (TIGR00290 family)